jgi:hypothetical protein
MKATAETPIAEKKPNLNHRGHWVAQGTTGETIEFRDLGVSAVKIYSTRSCAYPAAPSAEMISAI